MKKLILLTLTIIISNIVNSQSIQWENTFTRDSSCLNSLQETNDGGFILGGTDRSYNFDFWIIKTNQFGTLQWEKTFGGSSFESLNSLQQTNDGGFILGGSSASSDGDVSGNNGSSDFWIVKTDASGNLQWEKNFGGSSFESLNSLQQTSDGGFILGGSSSSSDGDVSGNNGSSDFWIIKTDVSGNLQWEKNFGGSSNETINSLQQTSDNGFILGGSSYSSDGNISGNNGSSDFWIVKTDASGNLQWEKNFGGSSNETINSLQQTSDDGFILGGSSSSSDGNVSGNNGLSDFWIVKTNQFGTFEWEKNFGGSSNEIISSLDQTSDGGFIFGGYSRSTDVDLSENNGLVTSKK